MGKEIACIKESCKVQKINPEVLMSFDWEFQGWEKRAKEKDREGERDREMEWRKYQQHLDNCPASVAQ